MTHGFEDVGREIADPQPVLNSAGAGCTADGSRFDAALRRVGIQRGRGIAKSASDRICAFDRLVRHHGQKGNDAAPAAGGSFIS